MARARIWNKEMIVIVAKHGARSVNICGSGALGIGAAVEGPSLMTESAVSGSEGRPKGNGT